MKQTVPLSPDFDFDDYIGVEILSAAKDRVVGRLMARQQHLTKGERIHGGLIVALAEALAGHGSGLNLEPASQTTTIELKTNFMQRGEPGPVFGVAVPLHVGRSTMVWQTTIHDEQDRKLAVVQQTQIIFKEEPDAAQHSQAVREEADGAGAATAGEQPKADAKHTGRSTSEQRRAQIIEAAFPLISKKGFAHTSVRDIAEAAGLSVPAIYKYVSNKDEILELIYDDYISKAGTSLAEAIGDSHSATHKLRNAIAASITELDRHQSHARMMYRETRSLQPEVRDRVKQQGMRYIDMFQEILNEGVESGEFRDIDTKLVASLIPQLCEIWTLRPWSVGSIGLDKVRDGITALVLSGVGSDEHS